ncbi:class I SAM-dependent methyltransferase [Amycolatopsis alkalitolerans]|uniref:Class I SAM-dependent methyltransferase n=1 Tax=Amycolatopsis alkalitolerans TaxID=2547244 RepID=A0A5C4M8N3_9PSEU|nr:class I SAM-dependent methyltransferase [Amycolatopsis alkalitolerans]TNC28537.1 class I SAM-dependent methyltransferase [Amycolatopsis alkalitolerans]
MARGKPLGSPTRGTTNPNRLRRVDRWLTASPLVSALLRHAADPLVVDLGYGASGITTAELAHRLRTACPRARVLGLELDPARVAAAAPLADPPRLGFSRGGFELAGTAPVVVRAFNVLRQYAEDEVEGAWKLILDSMAPGGLLVEGTCDEIGRLCSWVALRSDGPLSLTLSYKLSTLDRPSTVAERLPKALIHHNVPGEPVHEFLSLLDSCWAAAAPHRAFGVRFRWLRTVELLRARGWPVLDGPRRWRLGELTVPWHTVR